MCLSASDLKIVWGLDYWVELGGTAKQETYQFGIQSSSSQFILGDVALEV